MQAASIDAVFRALGDPTRRAMVDRLAHGPLTTSELAAPYAVSLAAIVQHLQVLEASGIVQTQKVGRVRTCALAPGGLQPAERWLAERRTQWERRFDRLADVLADPACADDTPDEMSDDTPDTT
jgi:DNA-binding transcriptional ArsR family regulator